MIILYPYRKTKNKTITVRLTEDEYAFLVRYAEKKDKQVHFYSYSVSDAVRDAIYEFCKNNS